MLATSHAKWRWTWPERSGWSAILSFVARFFLRFAFTVVAVLVVFAWSVAQAQSQSTTSRLIVKFADTTLKAAPEPASRVAKLAQSTNVSLRHLRTTALAADVVALAAPVTMGEAERIAKIIARDPTVEYAAADHFVKTSLVPNDPVAANQTYLNNDPFSIDAYAAWDTTTGSPSTVVAVVDSGYTDHAGLAGRFLPGYDFINTPFVANDGNLRNADAHDPGDWVTPSDVNAGPSALDCTPRNSTWHGTAVAGVIAANSNDGAWRSACSVSAAATIRTSSTDSRGQAD
jgi:serine protease